MGEIVREQRWNNATGQWEPQTNYDYIKNMNPEKLAEFLSKQFCYGYGEPQILEWLNRRRED